MDKAKFVFAWTMLHIVCEASDSVVPCRIAPVSR
jgi:hypothetical protein